MSPLNSAQRRIRFLLWILFATLVCDVYAFPPTPHHTIFGVVRDERGNRVISSDGDALVVLETEDGVTLTTEIREGHRENANYQLAVALDSGASLDRYRPTALMPFVPIQISVFLDGVRFAPIEVVGNPLSLGEPAGETRLDLTLGEDLDGDGLPDRWERSLGKGLDEVDPDGDADGDGLSNRVEYLAGTFATDPEDRLALEILGYDGGPQMEFLGVEGRTYQVFGSSDLKTWVPVIVEEEETSQQTDTIVMRLTRMLRVRVVDLESEEMVYFRLSAE